MTDDNRQLEGVEELPEELITEEDSVPSKTDIP